MKIVIVGNGKLGATLSEQLVRENHELTIIDTQSAVLEAAVNSMDVQIVQGNGASYEIQMKAGVPKADLLLALTASDELNMLCCIVAKKSVRNIPLHGCGIRNIRSRANFCGMN